MSIQKPSLPKGTRDFGPVQMARRNYIFDTIKTTFKLFGYDQLETPAIENLSTLTGKYGDEGDQLLFKILNSGDFLKKADNSDFQNGPNAMLPKIAEKGLRYDLTVPFARYVVMNRNEINFPFKRFQIQPVWRADRPQKGRYREFFQCDADVVGTNSLVCEAEILLMIKKVFGDLGLHDFTIKINNRKILTGIAETIGEAGKESSLCVALDKLDKIGWEKVQLEMIERGFGRESIEKLNPTIDITGGVENKLAFLETFLQNSEAGKQGIAEVKEVFEIVKGFGSPMDHIELDITLARGLSYYTGAIFEVKINHVNMGSVSGGGRYDNLTGVFGLNDIPGVGFSFGVDRIYDVMDELDLFPKSNYIGTKVLVGYFDQKEGFAFGLKVLRTLRNNGIASEIYPDDAKIRKQFQYADKKGIPYVIILGSDEIARQMITIRNMRTGEQQMLSLEETVSKLKKEDVVSKA